MKQADHRQEKIFLSLGTVLCVYFLLLVMVGVFFNNRFGLDAKIAGVSVSLKTKSEAVNIIDQRFKNYQNSQIDIDGVEYPVNQFLSSVKAQESIDQALADQQNNYFAFSFLRAEKFQAQIVTNDDAISSFLINKYEEYSVDSVNAQIILGTTPTIIADKDGVRLLLPESRQSLINTLTSFGTKDQLVKESLPADFKVSDAANLEQEAIQITAKPFTLTSARGNFTITSAELRNWVKITPEEPNTDILAYSLLPMSDNGTYTYFDQDKIAAWVNNVAQSIDQIANNATLAVVNGQVAITSPDTTGYTLDQTDAFNKIENMNTSNRTAALKITETKAAVRVDNFGSLGLNQLISTGYSNFAGSPSNRIHNIVTGADKFNGVLISPHERFSFNQTLGPVDATTGYLPELVILQNQTVPQFGGGLCQVSTTAFRAALNAGFPILERTWHAYPVSYYKPYGTDATIYLPEPDLVFSNDSDSYVLIQTRIIGNQLYFDFYGTKSANSVSFSGSQDGSNSVPIVEQVNPTITDQNLRGPNSFTATLYRFIHDASGNLIRTDTFVSKYDSPSNYPH